MTRHRSWLFATKVSYTGSISIELKIYDFKAPRCNLGNENVVYILRS